MEICNDGHPEVVYNSGGMFSGYKSCPVCEIIQLKEELEQRIIELEEEVSELEYKISEMEDD